MIIWFLLNLLLALGIQSIHYTIFIEILPEKIKDIGLPILLVFHSIFSSVFGTLASFIDHFAGDYAVMFIAAIICLIGAIIIYLKVPETKGKNKQEIMTSL